MDAAGRPLPFESPGDDSREAIEWRILKTVAPPTGRLDVPADLEQLVGRMLAGDPARRPASAALVARELGRIEQSLGGPAPADRPWRAGDAIPLDYVEPVPAPEAVHTADRAGGRRAPVGSTETVIKRPAVVAPAPPPAGEARSRAGWWVWAVAVAVVAAVATGIAVLGGGPGSHQPVVVDSGGNQDAGNGQAPGPAVVTARRLNPTTVRFTWTYDNPLATDSYRWQTPDGARSGTARKPSVDLPDPAGTPLCIQIMVVRQDGSNAALDWSPAGCSSD